MSVANKIVVLMGSIFLAVGVLVGCVFAAVNEPGKFPPGLVAIPVFFVLIGGVMDIVVMVMAYNKKQIVKRGTRYAAKIYGYTENTSVVVNNTFLLDTVVHYFDSYNVEREAIIPTGFSRGGGAYG